MKSQLIQPRNAWLWLAAIVVAVIVGHVSLQILTGEFRDWSLLEGVWLLSLFFISILASVVTIPRIHLPRIGRSGQREKPAVHPLNDIESAPALIVYVSTNPTGAYRTAIRQFADAPGSLLKHVFLVHSKQSRDVAKALYEEIENNPANSYTAQKDGLLADFSDLQDVYRVSLAAVARALEQVQNPEDVVIDVTGGTAIASAGAVLAGMRHKGVSLSYFAPGPTGGLGDTIKRVDVTLVPENGEQETALGDEAA